MESPGAILMGQPLRQGYESDVFGHVSFRILEHWATDSPTCPYTKLYLMVSTGDVSCVVCFGIRSSAPNVALVPRINTL